MITPRYPALWLAGSLSLALSVAAGVSGWQRGGYWLECLLWAVLSILAVLTAHLLPALLSRHGWLALAAVPVWLGIFAVVVFGHAQFFTLAEIHAGRDRVLQPVASSTESTAISQPVTPGRTAPAVARDLAKASAALVWLPEARRPAQREAVEALRLELATVQQAEAREAASLARQQSSIEAKAADPVGQRLAHAFSLHTGSVMLAVALVTALMLELASVILWCLTLAAPVPCEAKAGNPAIETSEPEAPPVQPASEATPSSNDALAILSLLKAKGRLSLGALQSGVSRRLRPALADLLTALEAAGQVRVIRHSRGQVVELAG